MVLPAQLLRRLSLVVRVGLLLSLGAVVLLAPTTVVTLEYTAQPEFCITCHNMQPFYDSWAGSAHADVSCIECHYAPGAVETFEGKLQALSQLAKYATRTQGTKPWAEVEDESCMRSGCHSVRGLEGEIAFGDVRFDHSPHLFENREGRGLRCTSCHSHVVQGGDHLEVSESVCFTCHLMPGDDHAGGRSDCRTCHETPHGTLEVAGRPFDHDEYLGRGVDCSECHESSIVGDAAVRPERCRSCHGEPELLARRGEPAFLHDVHIGGKKVECFECHDEIQHGLFREAPAHAGAGQSCSACHAGGHDAASLVFEGRGGRGVDDRPSRMYETRVACKACHGGRVPEGDAYASHHRGLASASEVECMHCHGPGVAGMLEGWQDTVGAQLERLSELCSAAGTDAAGADAEHAAALADARANLELVRADGSLGAHNPGYVLDLLGAAARDIDRARAHLEPGAAELATRGLPLRSEQGCTDCHLGVEREGAAGRGEFSHARHLVQAGLDCDSCHVPSAWGAAGGAHGRLTFAREDCASCHHSESDARPEYDPWDCAQCHAHQEAFLVGELDGFEPLPGAMADKDCADCHGEPPDIASPNPKLCGLCHDPEYVDFTETWRGEVGELRARLDAAIREGADADPEALEAARSAARAVDADGSGGAHNIDLARKLIEDALTGLGGE